jgi:CheY-like chemotaxis protein
MATILVIEDTPANQALAGKLLRAAGHEVLVASDATSGLAMARDRAPDLVLLDLGLPDMTGWDALSLFRSDDRTRALRVIAFTAHAMVGDRERALAAGFDGYMSKPIDYTTFAPSIARHLT